jgi:hypothetical protein
MNLKTIVKFSNIVAAVSIILLIYWVFIFVSIEVFGFKIFRENITQTFSMSILALLALMGGSLMLNVMFNLTRIAQKHNKDEVIERKGISKYVALGFLLSFPLIFGLLFGGDYLTSRKKEEMLIRTARSIVEMNSTKANEIAKYQFTKEWIVKTHESLSLISKSEKNFPDAAVIVRDSIDDVPTFLHFRDYYRRSDSIGNEIAPDKMDYILRSDQVEKDYLQSVFNEGSKEIRFSASDGNYHLYYPYVVEGKIVVLYFSDQQRYGKIGS